MPGYPCCCVECVEGEEPTAGFSYEQTDDDPCTIDLFDESTVHANCTDGTIVEWKWYLNAETTPFSTSQNPTGVEVTDGDDIRLWVRDSCGCTDEVVMAIACVDITVLTCSSYTFTLPTFLTVNYPAITDGTCTICLGGTRTLKLQTVTPGTVSCAAGTCCLFVYGLCDDGSTYPDATCPTAGGFYGEAKWQVQVSVPTNGTSDLEVLAKIGVKCPSSSDLQWYSASAAPWTDNLTSLSVSLPFTGTTTRCNGTSGSNANVSA
jgi:hypothetical protein